MIPKPLVIVGAGGFGRETADVVEAVNGAARAPLWELKGVYDDSPSTISLARLRNRNVPYLGPVPTEWGGGAMNFVIGIGNPSVRATLAKALDGLGWGAATLIHPAATIAPRIHIGSGTVICGGAQVSTNVHLGCHVHLNPNSTIGHDAILDDHVSINPGAIISGEVRIAAGTLVGAGAVILQGRTIGSGALVGAAACVVRDVTPGAVVKGVPAR